MGKTQEALVSEYQSPRLSSQAFQYVAIRAKGQGNSQRTMINDRITYTFEKAFLFLMNLSI